MQLLAKFKKILYNVHGVESQISGGSEPHVQIFF